MSNRLLSERPIWRSVQRLLVLAGCCAGTTLSIGCGDAQLFQRKEDATIARAAGATQTPQTADAQGNVATSDDGESWWEKVKHPFGGPKAPPGPADSMVLRAGHLEAEQAPIGGASATDVAGAHELYRQGNYADAEAIFHRVADNSKTPTPLAEEARYYEAECLRRRGDLPKAADTYKRLVEGKDFPAMAYREQSLQHMFEIANAWLDDTREEMREDKEKHEGKRFVVWPHFVNFDKKKPLLDEEGRAIELLNAVRFGDINGPLADKALFLAGSVMFFNKDYKEADHYFTQVVEMHPNSSFATQAVELAIISKHMSTGGSDYDGRKCAEARQLVDAAFRSYPQLANEKNDFLTRQLVGINMQQAEKDYKMAEFYRRTGHPGSAYFYYEIVRRRYPNTKFFDLATERMNELRGKLEKDPDATPAPLPTGVAPRNDAPAASPETLPSPRTVPSEKSGPPRLLPNLGQQQ